MNTHCPAQKRAGSQPEGDPHPQLSFPRAIVLCVWIPAVLVATLVTLILPESFSSTARIKIERDHHDIAGLAGPQGTMPYDPYFIQTEFEVIQSEVVLAKVIANLDLNKEWGRKYGGGDPLKTTESMGILKGRMDIRPVRNTSLIEIRLFSEKAEEAAMIANAVAEAYRDYRLTERTRKISASVQALEQAYEENNEKIRKARAEMDELAQQQGIQDTNRSDEAGTRLDNLQRHGQVLFTKLAAEKTDLSLPATTTVQIVDRAVPGFRPVRPNRPLNIAISILIGGLGGFSLATLVYVLRHWEARRKPEFPRTPFPLRFRSAVHILIALVVGFCTGFCCANPLALNTVIAGPLVLLVGCIGSAYVELANARLTPTSEAEPDEAELNEPTASS